MPVAIILPILLSSNPVPLKGNSFFLLEDNYLKRGLRVVADAASLELLHSYT